MHIASSNPTFPLFFAGNYGSGLYCIYSVHLSARHFGKSIRLSQPDCQEAVHADTSCTKEKWRGFYYQPEQFPIDPLVSKAIFKMKGRGCRMPNA